MKSFAFFLLTKRINLLYIIFANERMTCTDLLESLDFIYIKSPFVVRAFVRNVFSKGQ